MKNITKFPVEAVFWVTALLLLLQFEPGVGSHVAICPLQLAGFDGCPGCGIGRSISLAMQGHFKASFEYHLLGIPALLIILNRIYHLIIL